MGVLVPVQAQPAGPALNPDRLPTEYVHDVWQVDEGLPQNSVTSVLQTRDGHLWLGTEEGLVRFNGQAFRTFDRYNTPALEASQWVRTLHEGRDGTLWIGTNQGGLVRYAQSTFSPFAEAWLRGHEIRALAEGPDGTLWVGTFGEGLFACQAERCTRYTVREGLPSNRIRTLLMASSGTLWVGTEQGLVPFRNGKLLPWEATPPLPGRLVMALLEDPGGKLWTSFQGGGLYRLHPSGVVEWLSPEQGWPRDDVWSFWYDAAGSLWMGLSQGGLLRYHKGRFEAYTPEDGLSHARVTSLAGDREGSLWIGTDGGGLNRLRNSKITHLTTRDGLSNNTVLTVYEAPTGSLWIGTEGGGLNRLRDGVITHFGPREGLTNAVVTSVYTDAAGTLWAGTLGGGLYRRDDNRFTALTTRDGLPGNNIYALYRDRAGSLWVGTDAGLARYRNGVFTRYTTTEGLSSNSITALFEDHEGTLWVGTYDGGLNRQSQGRFAPVEMPTHSRFVTAFHEDREGRLWIGTYGGGLLRWHKGQFAPFTRQQGLFDDTIYQILEDAEGYLWMGCNKGVFRVSLRDLQAVAEGTLSQVSTAYYGGDDPEKRHEVNGGVQPAGWRSQDGRLWFPTVDGVAIINPQDIHRSAVPPAVVLEQIAVDNEPVNPFAPLNLKPGTEKITFDYVALSFTDPRELRYRYRLEGYETAWTEAGTAQQATYTHLDPGRYTFRVIAMNSEGVWNETGASVAFYLQPFFYQQPGFWLLVAFGLVGAGVFSYRLHMRRVKTRQRMLEALVEARTHDLQVAKNHIEAQAEELRGSLQEKEVLLREVHHRVKNNLQIINSLLHLQSLKLPEASTQELFRECQRRIQSMALIHERLYQSENLAQIDLAEYLRSIVETLVPSYRMASGQVTVQFEVHEGLMNVDQAITCGLIVNELVSNALKHGWTEGQRGLLCLRFDVVEGQCHLSVEDDGKGLPAGFVPERSPSLGLKLVAALARKLRGTLRVYTPERAVAAVTNGHAAREASPAGTVFEVVFPAPSSLKGEVDPLADPPAVPSILPASP